MTLTDLFFRILGEDYVVWRSKQSDTAPYQARRFNSGRWELLIQEPCPRSCPSLYWKPISSLCKEFQASLEIPDKYHQELNT